MSLTSIRDGWVCCGRRERGLGIEHQHLKAYAHQVTLLRYNNSNAQRTRIRAELDSGGILEISTTAMDSVTS